MRLNLVVVFGVLVFCGSLGVGRADVGDCDAEIIEFPELQEELEAASVDTECERQRRLRGEDLQCVPTKEVAMLRSDLLVVLGEVRSDVFDDIVLAWQDGWSDVMRRHEDAILGRSLIMSRLGVSDVGEAGSLSKYAAEIHSDDERTHTQAVESMKVVTSFAESHPELGSRYGSGDIMPGIFGYHLLRALFTADSCSGARKQQFNGSCRPDLVPIDALDVATWTEMYDSMDGSEWNVCRETREDPCSCSRVMCESQWGRNRRVVVAMHFGDMGLRGTLPENFSNFLNLRALRFFDEPFLDSKSSQYPILRLPSLQSLTTDIPISSLVSIPTLNSVPLSNRLIGLELSLMNESHPTLHAQHLTWICNLHALRSLHISGAATGLPECIGYNNSNLVEIDLRGAQLGKAPDKTPLPLSLGRLTQMKSFVAFQQGVRSCPPKHLLENKHALKKECRLNYDTLRGSNSVLWLCKEDGWFVDFSDRMQPWWKWTRLERFWVDANYFYGKIPPFIGTAWPAMRSLDIYSNNLTGPIPFKSLARMRHLTKLQFQDNNLEGEIPPGTFTPLNFPRLHHVNLQLNRNLKGCISTAPWTRAFSATKDDVVIGQLPAFLVAKSQVLLRENCMSSYKTKEDVEEL